MLSEFFNRIIDFLTDANGLGFPLLIAVGLGVILYMMSYSGKSWKKADRNVEDKKDSIDGINDQPKKFKKY